MRFDEHDKDLAGRLDGLLPAGSQFRAEAVWAGLNDALGRRRRVLYLHRAAVAAVLLLLLGTGWLLRGAGTEEQPPLAARPPVRKEVRKRPAVAVTEREMPAPAEEKKGNAVTNAQRHHSAAAPAIVPGPPANDEAAPVPLAVAVPPTAEATTPAMAATTAAPTARSRFRVGHMNEETVSQPIALEGPAEEAPNYGLLRHRATAGPSVESAEPASRPRTLMSLFKSHQ